MNRSERIRRELERHRKQRAQAAAAAPNPPRQDPTPAPQPPNPQAANPHFPAQPANHPITKSPKHQILSPAPPANHQIAKSPNHQIRPSAASPTSHADRRPDPAAGRSTVPDRLPPDLLARLHEQVLQVRPRQYKEIYQSLALAEHGLAYITFYRYARRLRSQAAFHEAIAFQPEGAHQAERELPRLYATRLIEALTLDHPSPLHLKRLAEGYRLVATIDSDFWRNLLPRGRH